MQLENIETAKRLAKQFLTSVSAMEKAEGDRGYTSPKHRGDVRRKSMDLTRALSEMRKP